MEHVRSTGLEHGYSTGSVEVSMSRIDQAVILAAGLGSRIRGESKATPKPLVRCGGITLLKRTMLTAAREGVRRFVLVVGCQGDEVQAAIDGDPDLAHLERVWVYNEDFKLKNGVSVLKARPHVQGEFFLMMSDHIVDRAIFRTLQSEPARGGLVLAVDYKLDTIFDMDDATKVKVAPHTQVLSSGLRPTVAIAQIGKEIPEFDAVDTGVFRVDPVLFEHLEAVFNVKGDTSLSDGVQALAKQGKARVADVGHAWWQDVDTPETRVYGDAMLLGMLGRPDDGPVSKAVNRRLSRPITARLKDTRIQPQHITFASLFLGLAAAALVATATGWWALALGGLFYQLTSILRGVDGELARLRMQDSEKGAWLDTVTDDIAHLAFLVAVGLGTSRLTGEPLWLGIALATAGAGALLMGNLYFALRALGLGAHRSLDWRFRNDGEGAFQRFCARFAFLAGRDVQAALLMALALTGAVGLQVALILSFLVVLGVSGQYVSTRVRANALRLAKATDRPREIQG